MTNPAALLDDLTAESEELDKLVSTLDDDGWRAPTPAPGWTIAHQIAHLAWTDRMSVLAATDRVAFDSELAGALADPTGYPEAGLAAALADPPAELLRGWRAGRKELVDALLSVPAGTRLPWFGPPMSVASMATARLMETWAHGQDIADTLAITRTPTARLRNVAHIGVRTVGFSFAVHTLPPPPEEFRVELTGPDGELWTWGPEQATNRITGPALDFCLLVTQRRNPADLAVEATGEHALAWVPIAQAFAGPPGVGRHPGEYA
ncbi:MAG TPA: TIGR03084 family metal-binding protein [Pseudonocardiaceae bacterium]|nr:TIGR03084 family metal-binding protein [Pseudonocardiaceae bacterium]